MLTAFSLLAFALAAQGQLDRWTDDGGKVQYTDAQPPASARNVEKKGPARAADAARVPVMVVGISVQKDF